MLSNIIFATRFLLFNLPGNAEVSYVFSVLIFSVTSIVLAYRAKEPAKPTKLDINTLTHKHINTLTP
jgi:hypothetical protein